MSLFKNLTTEGMEEAQDRLGGFSVFETDVYAGKLKVAYAGQSEGGARNVTLVMDFGGREYRETIYITNKKGENFFLNKENKKVALPGFTTVDDLCQVTTDKGLADQNTEDKVLNIYDREAGKEVPKSVPVLTELTDKDVLVAILKSTVDKTEKQGNDYVPTGESREENSIEKIFHPTLQVTVVEAKAGKSQGEFITAWVGRNKGKTRDKRQNKGSDARQGRPGANSGPPQAGQSGGVRKSLFGGGAQAA